MTQQKSINPVLSRRDSTRVLLAFGGALLLRCSGAMRQDDAGSDSGNGGGDAGGTPDVANAVDASAMVDGSTVAWARGGTAAMTGNYADPFGAMAGACSLAVAVTAGPCTEAADQVRQDISEGYLGLPMRLAFKIVNQACAPIAGAKVKIWHTQLNGSYSGATPNPQMCLKDQADSVKHYFRGVQTSDANGRVDFNSCFPGWYRGRAIHVHLEVSLNGRSSVTQIGFDQALIMELFTTHPDYQMFGQPDTPNATDMVLGGANLPTFIAQTSRLPDGALMAAKQIAVSLG